MVVHTNETNKKQSLMDLLGGGTKKQGDDTKNDMFQKLLATLKTPKAQSMDNIHLKKEQPHILHQEKTNHKEQLRMSFNDDAKTVKNHKFKDDLLSLLGKESSDVAILSKDISQNLTPTQLKMVFNEAKEYIKKEIVTKKPELLDSAKELPKTLSGLVSLAKKLDLNLSNISLADVVLAKDENIPQSLLTKPMFDIKAIAIMETVQNSSETSMDILSRLLKKPQVDEKIDSVSTQTTKNDESKEEASEPLKNLLKTKMTKSTADRPSLLNQDVSMQEDGQKSVTHQSSQSEILNSLLHSDAKNDNIETKLDRNIAVEPKSTHVLKIDSIEVKSAEAKQSMRVFASEIKEAIQDYKPPFTRIAMKLNPERLGQVDVTLIQRGNTIHVNIQSPNINSVAFLAHNATELRAQLAQQGITNTTMNFLAGGDSNQREQNQNPHQQKGYKTYESLEELELNEEQLSALEIIAPYYA